jgi:hypothetical protein
MQRYIDRTYRRGKYINLLVPVVILIGSCAYKFETKITWITNSIGFLFTLFKNFSTTFLHNESDFFTMKRLHLFYEKTQIEAEEIWNAFENNLNENENISNKLKELRHAIAEQKITENTLLRRLSKKEKRKINELTNIYLQKFNYHTYE